MGKDFYEIELSKSQVDLIKFLSQLSVEAFILWVER